MLLVYIADGLWILALSIMAGASREAGKRIWPNARVPLAFGPGGRPLLRAPRNLALAAGPVLATAFGLALLAVARDAAGGGSANAQLLIFGGRMFAASILALLHLVWLRGVFRTLSAEGALKP